MHFCVSSTLAYHLIVTLLIVHHYSFRWKCLRPFYGILAVNCCVSRVLVPKT